ncbi:MAG: hypothetical protein E1N59_3195 [Puniceicoccaceae bacterium 5H]|nr:MAG: hypothetical protein E1N59_3195 [Puniceicoccaceae bacterium 5H]
MKAIFPVLAACAIAAQLSGATATVRFEVFQQVDDYQLLTSDEDLRFIAYDEVEGAEATTHLFFSGLAAIYTDSTVADARYAAVDAETATVYDVGHLYLTLPDALADDSGASSGLFGVVPRNGQWSNYSVSTPTVSPVGGAEGDFVFDDAGHVTFDGLGRLSLTGTSTFVVADEQHVVIEPYALGFSSTSWGFRRTTLQRLDGEFIGVSVGGVVSASNNAPPSYDAQMFAVRVFDVPDADFDGVPDLVDDDVTAFAYVDGAWTYHPVSGWVYGFGPVWGWSVVTGFSHYDALPWIYTYETGWIYYGGRNDYGLWYWIPETGWVLTADDAAGAYDYEPWGDGDKISGSFY